MEVLNWLLSPLSLALWGLAMLILAGRLDGRRIHTRADRAGTAVPLYNIPPANEEGRAPRRRFVEPVSVAARERAPTTLPIPVEDRVMILALDFFGRARRCEQPAEALAALRVAESLLLAEAGETSLAVGTRRPPPAGVRQ